MTKEQAWARFNTIDDGQPRSTPELRKQKWQIVKELRDSGNHTLADQIEWGIKNQ